jgi:hypothetical protein
LGEQLSAFCLAETQPCLLQHPQANILVDLAIVPLALLQALHSQPLQLPLTQSTELLQCSLLLTILACHPRHSQRPVVRCLLKLGLSLLGHIVDVFYIARLELLGLLELEGEELGNLLFGETVVAIWVKDLPDLF